MRSKKLQYFTMVAGSLLAVVILWAQFFAHYHAIAGQAVKTEQQESSQPADETIVALPTFSLPTPFHVQSDLDSYCLFEILFEDQSEENSESETRLLPGKFLTTLFRVIIAPNAP